MHSITKGVYYDGTMYINKGKQAFTLIELLVVIAIIGILASVVLGRLSGARASAQNAKTMASLRSAQTAASFCVQDNENLTVPNIANVICVGQSNWPAPVGDGWSYGNFGACAFDGDVSDSTFTYCANNGTTVISCTESGCNTT